MPGPAFQMWVRDAALNRVVLVRDWIRSDFTIRHNDSGRWVLDVPADGNVAAALTPGAGIILVDTTNNAVVFSGVVDEPEDEWDAGHITGLYRASGPDDLGMLAYKLALPNPARVVQNSYYGNVIASLPDLYYRMNETTGTVAVDVSGNKANGVYSAGVELASGNASGTVDVFAVPLFLGSADYLLSGTPPAALTPSALAVEFWIWTGYAGNDGVAHGMWSNREDGGGDGANAMLLWKGTDNNLTFRVWNSGATASGSAQVSAAGWAAGGWRHIVAQFGAGTVELWVNGVLANSVAMPSGSLSAVIAQGTKFRLGSAFGTADPNGWFDDYAVYGRKLTAAEITNHYQAGLTVANFTDTRKAAAETVIRQYLDANIGPTAPVARRTTGLALWTDAAQGSTVQVDARFNSLLEIVQQVALADGNIGLKLLQSATSAAINASVYIPRNLTASVVYSADRRNLFDYSRQRRGPQATFVYVGASGTGVDRMIAEGQDSTALATWGRREAYGDSSISGGQTLSQSITGLLRQKAARDDVNANPVWLDSLQYGRDYGLGDLVTVMVRGQAVTGVVREVRISGDANGPWTVRPTIGPAGIGSTDRGAQLQSIARRITALETTPIAGGSVTLNVSSSSPPPDLSGYSPAVHIHPDDGYPASYFGLATGGVDNTAHWDNDVVPWMATSPGGRINLGRGVYELPAQNNARAMRERITLAGQGRGATILRLPNGANADFITCHISTGSTDPTGKLITLRDLTVDGNKANQSAGNWRGIFFAEPGVTGGPAIDYTFDPHNLLMNVEVKNTKGDGCGNSGASEMRYLNVWSRLCDGEGFVPSFDAWLSDCTADQAGKNGFRIGLGSIGLSNCKAFYCGRLGVSNSTPVTGHGLYLPSVGSSGGANITNFRAQDNQGNGVYIDNTRWVEINGLLCDSNGWGAAPGTYVGLLVWDAQYCEVTNYSSFDRAVNLGPSGAVVYQKNALDMNGSGAGVTHHVYITGKHAGNTTAQDAAMGPAIKQFNTTNAVNCKVTFNGTLTSS